MYHAEEKKNPQSIAPRARPLTAGSHIEMAVTKAAAYIQATPLEETCARLCEREAESAVGGLWVFTAELKNAPLGRCA